ncbi:hypothetical protein ACQKP5_06575 [Pseudomonas vancouverensis]|uniref:hypothetical protein n=1 Tax=Pseudomonas vancouverensis TaxID=95300 RepID=UPI003D007D46
MNIVLSPQRRDDEYVLVKSGDAISINGEIFDFSQMGEGDSLPASAIQSEWFVDKVERIEGQLNITLLFPNPWNYSPAQAFPEPLLAVPDGPVTLPEPLSIKGHETEAVGEMP